MKKTISFICIFASVMLLGVGTQFFRGQSMLLLVCIAGAAALFIGGIILHKRAA